MTYQTEAEKIGREPFVIVGLVMDYCSLTAGVGACTATETGNAKCYNTRVTCNDPANYAKTTKEYKFCQPRASLPQGENMFPVIEGNPQKAATSTTAGSGLGKRAVVNVKIKDFPHHDRGIDPYYSERTYDAVNQGTFWGRFLKRNPYYEGRTIKIYYGYIGDTFSFNDFDVQEYDIIDIDGVSKSMVRITGKDILVRTYDRKAQYPAANTGELLSGISAGAGTATLTPTGIGNTEYSASGTLSIGDEVFTFTRSGDVLTLTGNAQWGTEQDDHSAGDLVQECIAWNGTNVVDVMDELLTTGAGIAASYIPTTDWNTEKADWLSSADVTGILMKPESIEKVIGELSESFLFDLWWDATAQEIKLKALAPESGGETINTLTEASNIVKDSLKIERKSKERFTEVRVFYDKLDYSEDNKPEHFKALKISADVTRSSADLYDGNSIKTVMSRWFNSLAQANTLSSRLLARFADTPETISFKMDAKDYNKMEMAGRIDLNSWQFQGFDGANEDRRFQVIEISERNDVGNSFMVKALTSSFVSDNYAFVAPDVTPDYTLASQNEKDSYGFIALDTGLMSNGDEGYYII